MIWGRKKKTTQQKQMEVHLSKLQKKLLEMLMNSLSKCMPNEEAKYYVFFSAPGGKAPKKLTILEKTEKE